MILILAILSLVAIWVFACLVLGGLLDEAERIKREELN